MDKPKHTWVDAIVLAVIVVMVGLLWWKGYTVNWGPTLKIFVFGALLGGAGAVIRRRK